MQIKSIYVEERVKDHPRTQEILKRYSQIPQISCRNYGEIFNRKAQNFRLQKSFPSLILAHKFPPFFLPTPKECAVGEGKHFYFSHLLNCPYDCTYCFLKGFYRSSYYVLFVNYEDFQETIKQEIEKAPQEKSFFFSGYDCDSLAREELTHFVRDFMPFFSSHPKAFFEIRTKNTVLGPLLESPSLSNCVVAYTLSPSPLAEVLEKRAPSLKMRLKALKALGEKGWPLGLRFDPLIFVRDYQKIYRAFFREVFEIIDLATLHSITIGPFRIPRAVYRNLVQLYPDEKLFACALKEGEAIVTYPEEKKEELLEFCREELLQYIPEKLVYKMEE